MVENHQARARLLSTAALHYPEAPESGNHSTAKLKHGRFVGGNGSAIFIGLGIGAVLVTVLTTYYKGATSSATPRDLRQVESPSAKQTPGVTTTVPSPPDVEAAAPRIALSPEMFKVTAISLGHPRLAVINRQQVAEGDWIDVYTPNARVSVKLRVIKIADGEIEFTIGNQVLRVPLQHVKLGAPRKR